MHDSPSAQPAPETVLSVAVRNVTLEDAAQRVEARANGYDEEHGTTDPETGTREYPGDGAEYVAELQEIADDIRAMKSAHAGGPMDDMPALIRRLVHALRKAAPEHDLPAKALDYLKRHGLQGSPLRDVAAPAATQAQAQPVAWMAFATLDGRPLALPEYAAADAPGVMGKVLDAARKEGFRGTGKERMQQLGWWAAPVHLQSAPVGDGPAGNVKPDNARQVFFYEQDFYVLSNFSSFNLRWKGWTFPTSEHAYHWEKFEPCTRALGDGSYVRDAILDAPSAHAAYKCAERVKNLRRRDWDDVKVGIMRDILRAKAAQHEYVRRKLLATGDRELIEDSWRDDFWGWGPNRDGQNMLGKLWMQVRAELRAGQAGGGKP